jgi:hypothetical protein
MVHQPSPYNPDNTNRSQEEMRLHNLDNRLQADPEMAEGPASGARIAMYAIAIALVLGVVFYGLNTGGMNRTGTTTPNQAAQQSPAANPASSTTTGAATTNRPTPPSPKPTGTEVDRSKQ